MLLSLITCGDSREQIGRTKNPILSSIQKKQACADEDSCSPLCTCNCCGQLLVFSLKFSLINLTKPVAGSKKEAEYSNAFASGYLDKIWQPPKMDTIVIG